jgi:hypothetical protein
LIDFLSGSSSGAMIVYGILLVTHGEGMGMVSSLSLSLNDSNICKIVVVDRLDNRH